MGRGHLIGCLVRLFSLLLMQAKEGINEVRASRTRRHLQRTYSNGTVGRSIDHHPHHQSRADTLRHKQEGERGYTLKVTSSGKQNLRSIPFGRGFTPQHGLIICQQAQTAPTANTFQKPLP